MIALKQQFSAVQLDLSARGFDALRLIDVVGIKCCFNHLFLFIFVVYINPRTSTEEYNSFFSLISNLTELHNQRVLIVGDFNIPEYHYNLQASAIGNNRLSSLSNFLNLCDYKQHSNIANSHGRFLDLVITNLLCVIDRCVDHLLPEDAHHPSLLITCQFRLPNTQLLGNPVSPAKKWNFRKADYPNLYRHLEQIDWSFMDSVTDVNTLCRLFYDKLNSVLDLYVPKTCRLHNYSYPLWFSSDNIKKVKIKWKLWCIYKRSHSDLDLINFKRIRAELKRDIKLSYANYIHNLEININSDPRKFWAHVNNIKKRSGIPSQMSYLNTSLLNPQDIVNAFAEHFSDSYSNLAHVDFNSLDEDLSNIPVFVSAIDESDVLEALKNIKSNSTCGHDDIPGFLLSDCATAFSRPLTILFNLILKSSSFPNFWKLSLITPIFKKGNTQLIINYRPISLLCNFSKVFESILHKFIQFQVRNRLSHTQHGFINGRSTVTNLCCFTQFVSDSFDAKRQVDVVYTDFSKAFDQLNHNILLSKLSSIGFSANLIKLFRSYLSGRSQRVTFHGFESDRIIVTSGVPQGSILGPLLFAIFINDITKNLSSNVLMYADDLKIFRRINNFEDCLELQDDIDKFQNWSIYNLLPVNARKCYVMSLTNKTSKVLYLYSMFSSTLSRVDSFKDLGVTFDSSLSFAPHVSFIVSEAVKCLGFIIRSSGCFSNGTTLKRLYVAFVRSKLEYASVVWAPATQIHIQALEKIQRRFLKFVSFKLDGVYPPRGIPQNVLLERFGLIDLDRRRTNASLCFLKKIFNHQIDCPQLLSQLYISIPRPSFRPENYQFFYLPTPRIDIQKNSPLYRMCANYNEHNDSFRLC